MVTLVMNAPSLPCHPARMAAVRLKKATRPGARQYVANGRSRWQQRTHASRQFAAAAVQFSIRFFFFVSCVAK